jgi:thymidylate synthase (FAD)
LKLIERAGRVCYKSEGKITDGSDKKFVEGIIRRGHESVIEHEKATALFVMDRIGSQSIVRHRIASYSQESTRFCNYSGDRFGNEITVIKPFFFDKYDKKGLWQTACYTAQQYYFLLLDAGATPQEARSVLPNSLKTEIVVTYNLREWRHFFKLRCAKDAHPQMQQVAIPLLLHFKEILPEIFGDVPYNEDFDTKYYAEIKTPV